MATHPSYRSVEATESALKVASQHCLILRSVRADHRNAPVNALGYLRIMFAVDDIDETLGRLRKRGAQLVGDVVRYQDSYWLYYIRGPEGLLIGLAQELN
jgi:hypothetical protein